MGRQGNSMGSIRFALLGSIGAASIGTASIGAAQAEQVRVAEGRLAGVRDGDVVAYKGVPFAAPPVGPLRWRAPQPAATWAGVRDARDYRNDCMQLPFPSDAAPLGTRPAEDCLYANVWRPADARKRLPVLVWIYGGGFVNGGASPPTYAGAALARQGIVFASFNYRVGRFGTFAHPALTRADADHGLLGNYGYLDQIAALMWIRRNIAAFGGDPDQVTIVGESAGGMSVHNLLTSPLAKGLFRRAVIQSGGDGGGMGGAARLAEVEAIGVTFATSKGIAADDSDALAKLRALPADTVTDGLNLATMRRPGPRTVSAPFADGRIAVDVLPAYAAGRFAHVPVMVGATSGDIGGRTGMMVRGARDIAGLLADKGLPVYHYRFSYVAQSAAGSGGQGAGHASDIPFFFHTADIKYGDRTTARDRAAAGFASSYLVNFVKHGDPNGPGLPTWRRFDRGGDEMLDFAADGSAVPGRDPWATEGR
jgi:para-nitrobenzyl esterase